jgi:Zn-dependent protease
MFDINAIIQAVAIAAYPVILAITLHEAAHAYVAWRLGDQTAWLLGRVSLNPVRHVDPVGTLLLPLLTFLVSGGSLLLGYAKTPVDFSQLRNPKKDMLWVALAGPFANLLMAFGWALLFKLSWYVPDYFSLPLAMMAKVGIKLNCVFMVLNLLPLPGLDGGRIAVSLLPHALAWKFAQLERWGFPILLLLLFTGILGTLMTPLVAISMGAIEAIFGLY